MPHTGDNSDAKRSRSATPEGDHQGGRQRSRAACAPCKSARSIAFSPTRHANVTSTYTTSFRPAEEAQVRWQDALWHLCAL
jgi:hypothetical protein